MAHKIADVKSVNPKHLFCVFSIIAGQTANKSVSYKCFENQLSAPLFQWYNKAQIKK